jgi:hypothetical protein
MPEADAQNQPTDDDLTDLYAKLNALDLSAVQRELLNTIVSIAWDVTREDESLDAQFAGSFEPGQAGVMMHYYDTASTSLISRAVGPAQTHLISRLISR